MIKTLLNSIHSQAVFKRRVRVLGQQLAECVTENELTLLDIGCGDGSIATTIVQQRPLITINGVDVIERSNAFIPTTLYDGKTLPFEDNAFDCAMLVDVLHHTDDPELVLAEAKRVAIRAVIIKDHLCQHQVDHLILRFMDWVGNRGHDVRLPYNYLSQSRWNEIFSNLELTKSMWEQSLGIYPQPFDLVFGGNLHFVARLEL